MAFEYKKIIDRYYPDGGADSSARSSRYIYVNHCRSVAELALWLARRNNLELSEREILESAMLHDIGIVLTDAPGICCFGREKYLAHGRLGAQLLRANGAPEIYARVAERHTGVGLTSEDVVRLNISSVPSDVVYMPQSQLERLICYADKFYSKSGDMQMKPLERVRKSIAKFGEDTLARFENLRKEFGDVEPFDKMP